MGANTDEGLQPLYLNFLGLQRAPFPLVPDAERLFAPARIDMALDEVLHAIEARKGFIAITGEVGLGKTTLSRRILRELDSDGVATSLIFNTLLEGPALLRAINRDFGVELPESDDLNAHLEALNQFLLARDAEGGNCVIIVDDAQNLSVDALELARLISNLESDTHKLVQIVLVGQPELLDRLSAHNLRQLKSRIVVHVRMQPFTQNETRQYITFRLTTSGSGGGIPIDNAAYQRIHRICGGNPRRINILMDRCLYGLYATGERRLRARLVMQVARELSMEHQRGPAPWRTIAAAMLVGGVALGVIFSALFYSFRSQLPFHIQAQTPAARSTGPITRPSSADAAIRAKVHAFLQSADLGRFTNALQHALVSGNLTTVAHNIADSSGWRLVELSRPDLAGSAQVLTWRNGNGHRRHLLLWHPRYWVSNFYYGATSEPIHQLQLELSRLGFYQGRVDGVVGGRTIAAVLAFQRRYGLPLSGQPNAATQYLLARAAEEM